MMAIYCTEISNKKATKEGEDIRIDKMYFSRWVKLYEVYIVSWCSDRIRLDYEMYPTATTKRRMNQVLYWYDLGFNVFQKKYKWWVSYNGKDYPFDEDGIVILDR